MIDYSQLQGRYLTQGEYQEVYKVLEILPPDTSDPDLTVQFARVHNLVKDKEERLFIEGVKNGLFEVVPESMPPEKLDKLVQFYKAAPELAAIEAAIMDNREARAD